MVKKKKAQEAVGMSFSTIFSILLIIFFMVIAGIVIVKFLETKKCTQVGMFVSSLKQSVDNSFNSEDSQEPFSKSVPSEYKYVCFVDFSAPITSAKVDKSELDNFKGNTENVFLYPFITMCEMPPIHVDHLDISKITIDENPYCIPIFSGKVKFNVEKGFNEKLVRITR